MKIIDLTCKGCGSSMDFVEPNENFEVEYTSEKGNTSVTFFRTDDTRIKMECPHCHKKQLAWFAGEKTNHANLKVTGNNNNVVTFYGNVTNSNIVVGDNKVVRR